MTKARVQEKGASPMNRLGSNLSKLGLFSDLTLMSVTLPFKSSPPAPLSGISHLETTL